MNDVNLVQPDRLRSFIERIERLTGEKDSLSADIREVFAEAKSVGYNPKIMRQVLKMRALEAHEREEQEMELDTYLRALGMVEHSGAEPMREAAE